MHQPSFPSFLLAFATWERSPWLCLFRLLRIFVAFFSYDGENWDCINKIFASTPQASSVSELACPGKPPQTMSSASYSVHSPFIHIAYVFTVAKYSTWNFSFPYKFADSKCFTETMYCKVFHLELSISQTLHVPSSLFWQLLLALDSHYQNFGR